MKLSDRPQGVPLTFSSAALYSPRWDEMPDRERSEGLFVQKKKKKKKGREEKRKGDAQGNWILMRFDIFSGRCILSVSIMLDNGDLGSVTIEYDVSWDLIILDLLNVNFR